ncbi:PAS domain-containing sensor histidine kinase [Flavobacterium sp. W22_SRS_FP1]|uniref:PAS domain-containing sensor histidine kinase n=1 Tax=Flavobacterium sp. W22_SRS_FP1 TaxID=3240276 RepID=UPI003F8FEC54
MEIPSPSQNKKDKNIFVENNFQNQFDSILSFISDLSEVPYVYLNIKDINDDSKSNNYNLGFNSDITDDLLSIIEAVAVQNKPYILPNSDKDKDVKLGYLSNNSTPLVFFAGFPVTNKLGKVIGVLSVMDVKPKILSPLQLKIISQSITNIQFLINARNENNELQNTLKEKEYLFDSHYENSVEVVYEFDEQGIITYFSKNWKTLLGHERSAVLGSSFSCFIHPDDMNICMNAVVNLTERKTLKEEITYRIKQQNGSYVWHSAILKIVDTKKGYYFVGNCKDITEHLESKQKLESQKDFYIKILDRLPTGVAVFDKNYKYVYLNPTAIKNDELRKFIVGKDDFEYAIHTARDPAFAELRFSKFLEAMESKKLIEWQDEITQSNGSITTHNRKYNPVFNEDGTLEMMVGFGTDITESVKNENEIIESKKLLTSILENVNTGILVVGPDSIITKNNKAACEMLGQSEEQLLGKTPSDPDWKIMYPDGKEFKSEDLPILKAIKELKQITRVVMGIYRPLTNDLVWLLVDANPVFNDNKSLLYVVCSFKEISNQINAENELRVSNERFLYANKATSDVIYDWDLATKKVFYGDGYYETFGFKFNNSLYDIGENSNLLHPSDKHETYRSLNETILSNTDFWEQEYRHLKPDNSYAVVKDTAYILRNKKGEAIRIIGAMKDITEKRALKDQLRQSEEQFKDAFNDSAAGMAFINSDGYYTEINTRLSKILGYTISEMKLLRFEDIMYRNDFQKYLIYKAKLDSHKIPSFTAEIGFINKNKSTVWISLSVSLIKKNQQYICQFIDITNRKKIEDENKLLLDEKNANKQIQLDEAENLYRLIADNTVDLVCLHDLKTLFEYVSPSLKNLVGYQPEELIGKAPSDFVHPEDLERFQQSIRTKDFWQNKVSKSDNYRFQHADGGYIWLQITTSLLEKNGIAVGFQTNGRDVTKELAAQHNVEEALLKERKLNELRTNLVSTISHEFRTPMTTIRTSAELINMYLEAPQVENHPRLQKRVDIITQEIDRLVELMNAVLTISKEDAGKTTYNPSLFNLKTLCTETIDKNFTEIKDKGQVKVKFVGSNFLVLADRNLMEYSISNILSNGFKYSPNSKDIELNITSTATTCTVQIIDHGIGIPKKDQDKLFNTFFRASNTDGIAGTGLGLYIVKTFVEKNKGTITLESKLGKGTKITMSFPLIKDK